MKLHFPACGSVGKVRWTRNPAFPGPTLQRIASMTVLRNSVFIAATSLALPGAAFAHVFLQE
jgi:hypothetical protein